MALDSVQGAWLFLRADLSALSAAGRRETVDDGLADIRIFRSCRTA